MKGFLIAVATILSFLWVAYIAADVHASFQYENQVESYWTLSEKASTLEQKSAYLDQFVKALDDSHLSGNGAWIWQTPDNDYGQNYTALKSLQQRMEEIKGMNVKSFEYQQAISQITAQEQGEARTLLACIKDVWFKCQHPLFWGPWELLGIFGLLIALIVAWVFACVVGRD